MNFRQIVDGKTAPFFNGKQGDLAFPSDYSRINYKETFAEYFAGYALGDLSPESAKFFEDNVLKPIVEKSNAPRSASAIEKVAFRVAALLTARAKQFDISP